MIPPPCCLMLHTQILPSANRRSLKIIGVNGATSMKPTNGIRTAKAVAAAVLLCSLSMLAQVHGANSHVQTNQSGNGPVFRITVVERTAKAINYRHPSGSTPVDF